MKKVTTKTIKIFNTKITIETTKNVKRIGRNKQLEINARKDRINAFLHSTPMVVLGMLVTGAILYVLMYGAILLDNMAK